MGHVIDGILSIPKNSCFLAFSHVLQVQNFERLIFCPLVMVGLDENSLEILLSIFGFIGHSLMLEKRCLIFF